MTRGIMTNIWQGERVRLRAWEPSDFEALRRDGIENVSDARLYDAIGVPRSEAEARRRPPGAPDDP